MVKDWRSYCCVCSANSDIIISYAKKSYCHKHWLKQCDKEEKAFEKEKLEPQKNLKVYL